MRIMHIEDQDDYKNEIRSKLSRSIKVIPYTGTDVNGNSFDLDAHADGSNPIEVQIANQLKSYEDAGEEIDLVLLDTDLSGMQNPISQSSVRSACSSLGIPVCRYSKKGFVTQHERMKYLATISREGSQSILIPDDILASDNLSAWLSHAADSFKKIRVAINKSGGKGMLSPSELMAKILKVPGIDVELMGYSGANFFFFGDLIERAENNSTPSDRHYSTQFGYWLCNYVLLFPGPILNIGATAAYLEISKDDIEKQEVAELLKSAKYTGPFSKFSPYYVRQKLDSFLLKSDCDDFVEYFKNKKIDVNKLPDSDAGPSFYCVVNDEPIPASQAKGPLDWIPRGATICRVKKDTYEKFGPWLNV